MLTFQQIVHKLTDFWEKQGCIIHFGHDLETGAGTFNPATFLRCLGPEPYKTAYVEPSRRPSDGRYGENPNRLQLFHQFQVIIKPSPLNILDLYKESLTAIGIDLKQHDLRFVHDDWESPTLGAYGLGWEVWIDGMEVTQFTYFQGLASLSLKPVSGEITYGLERLCMYVQNKDNFFDMQWNENYTFRDIIKRNEIEWSAYNFTKASSEMWFRHFDDFEQEAKGLIDQGLPLPAYDFVIKASHAFNILNARGVISVTERAGYIARIRDLARLIANAYLEMREKEGFPLLEKLGKEPQTKLTLSEIPKKFNPDRKESFLFEIGSEDLPATFIPIGMQSLEKGLTTLFKDNGLKFDRVKVFGANRRLGALVDGLVEGTGDQVTERKGPNAANAFDPNGNPTQQGKGFFSSLGVENVTLSKLQKGEIKGVEIRGDYLFASIKKQGRSIYTILSEELPKLILNLDFPKKMRWGNLDVLYPRPIHWIVALYGNHVIPFIFGNIASDRFSFGHAQLDPKKIILQNPKEYIELLKQHKVQADVDERKKNIETQLAELEKKLGGKALEKQKVMSQVLYLSEWPMLTHADFSSHFLKAPPEVLISEMVEHQKYFPFADTTGKLKNLFIITADNTPNDLIRHGNQKVLSARLADGVFLYEQDLSVPLEKFNEKLEKMTFQNKLGSMKDKVMRVVKLADYLNSILKIADPKKVARAALLCKADLTSDMVGEFPELQGTMGKYFATGQREDVEVAQAIEEHWMPRTEKGELPKTPTGIVLGLADKLDNLVSYFQVGLKPTSSSDPYALRRQAIGIVKILIANKISLSLDKILNEEVLHFITNRAKGIFEEMGFEKDLIDAAIGSICRDPYDQYCKVAALNPIRGTESFDKLFEVYKRAKGQLQQGKPGTFDPSLVKEPAEKELLSALLFLEKNWKKLLEQKKYKEAFEEMAKLQEPLAHLFDTVKILAEDPRLRENRLSLLNRIFAHFDELLDFSKIQSKQTVSHGSR